MMPVSVEIRRASGRFVTRSTGRATQHSFSFGEHYDADNLGFGPMVCHDDHHLARGEGFSDHPHQDLEIVTWVLSGSLVHDGSDGHSGIIEPGTVQVLSAGSGVVHSEIASPTGRLLRFVQVWLRPDEASTSASYATASVTLPTGTLVPVASGHHRDAALRLGTASATFWVARLDSGDSITLPDEPLQHVFVGHGALTRSSMAEPLTTGDAFRVTDQGGLAVTAAVPTELLVWTFTTR